MLRSSQQQNASKGRGKSGSSMSEQDEDEYIEEEAVILLSFPELDGLVSMINEDAVLQFTGLETENPSCSIRNLEFEGAQKLLLGTHLLFSPKATKAEELHVGTAINQIEFKLKNVYPDKSTTDNNPASSQNDMMNDEN